MRQSTARNSRPSHRFLPRSEVLECRSLLSTDVLTYHYDNMRSGVDSSETTLTPANVNSSSFGKLGFDAVDGKVDAQPLYVSGVAIPGQGTHNVLYVATEHDSVYAFDADSGSLLWKVSVLGAGEVPSDPVAGNQVTPEIGITSTPVIDPNTDTMYVVAMSKLVSGSNTTYIQRLHALDITTGADKLTPHSIDSSISFPGSGPGGNGTDVFFNPKQYEERDALLLDHGVIYTGWASHSDVPPYTSWVIGFRASDLGLAYVLNLNPNGKPTSSFLDDGSGGSFWNSGAGPAADSSGNIYNLTANGPFDPNLNTGGFPANGDYGDSMVRMTPTANGLTVSDYFTPSNQQVEANQDEDLGSSGLVLVDVPGPTGAIEHLAVGSGKDGNIYVVNRDNMGKFSSTGNNIVQELPNALGGGEFGAPVAFNDVIYFGAAGSTLRAFRFVNGTLQATPASAATNGFVYPGATPVVSANGTANGIVWAAENSPSAALHAYDASNLADELYNSGAVPNGRDFFGAGNKFITPVVANGKVYVGTQNGVGVFGLFPTTVTPPPPPPPPVTPPPVVVPDQVDLTSSFNRIGITPDGATFSGGLDGLGSAFSANQLGPTIVAGGIGFGLGPVGSPNVVGAFGQTIAIAPGKDSVLKILAIGIGNHPNQTFVVTYTDGSHQVFRRSISDWSRQRRYPLETRATATPYRNLANGSRASIAANVNVYSFNLNKSKTVRSITLPRNANVEILAATAIPAPMRRFVIRGFRR